MTAWAVILTAALFTYALRASALVAIDGGKLPSSIERHIGLVAPASLGALISSSSIHNDQTLAVGIASSAAFLAARRLHTPYAALLVGFPTLWCIQLVIR